MSIQKSLFFFFAGIAAVYLVFSVANFEEGTFYLKPLLLVPLIAMTVITGNFSHKQTLFAALLFCWIGDILLLFAGRDTMYFIMGLIAFLVGHLFYIFLFLRMIKTAGGKGRASFPALSIILVYLIAFYTFMAPHLGGMLIPVMVYAVVISTMLYFAVVFYRVLPRYQTLIILSGAISFVISDSLLAINKFYLPLPLSGFLIMLTYIYAQGAIVWGCFNGISLINEFKVDETIHPGQ